MSFPFTCSTTGESSDETVFVPAVTGAALAAVARFCHAAVQQTRETPLKPPPPQHQRAEEPPPTPAAATSTLPAAGAAPPTPGTALAQLRTPVGFAEWDRAFIPQALRECGLPSLAQARARPLTFSASPASVAPPRVARLWLTPGRFRIVPRRAGG